MLALRTGSIHGKLHKMSAATRGIALRIAMGTAGAIAVGWFTWGEEATPELTWLLPGFPATSATRTLVGTRSDLWWCTLGVNDAYARVALGIAGALVLALLFAAVLRETLRRYPSHLVAAYTQRDALKGTSMLAAAIAAVAAAVGEELCFRGLFAPTLGLTLSALAFGLLHRLPSTATWAFRALAFGFGLVASALVYWTGQLACAIAFHAAMNLLGLAYLWDLERPVRQRRREHPPTPPQSHRRRFDAQSAAPTHP
jgi:membrane protease YdiL (CAAX protease family)